MIPFQLESVNQTYSDYLIVPPYIYNLDIYPTFTSGTGYIVPWWILPCLYQGPILPNFLSCRKLNRLWRIILMKIEF